MKVKHLQELLTKMNPEALVVVSSLDHSYREIRRANNATAEYNKADRYLGEIHDDRQELEDGSIIVPVVVIE